MHIDPKFSKFRANTFLNVVSHGNMTLVSAYLSGFILASEGPTFGYLLACIS